MQQLMMNHRWLLAVLSFGGSFGGLMGPVECQEPVDVQQIHFRISNRHIAVSEDLHVVFADKRGVKNPSGQFYWTSQNADGIYVMIDLKAGKVYGQRTITTPQGPEDEFHEIGTYEGGVIHFLKGRSFTYTPASFTLPDVVEVRILSDTKAVFTKPVK